jgi:protein-disulfide isomerase
MARSVARRKVTKRKTDNTRWLIVGGIAAIVIVAALIYVSTLSSAAPAAAPQDVSGEIWGSPNAPVVVQEYADLQCPVCAEAYQELHALAPKYIDTGKVQIVFHHYAFIGPESELAAQGAECANEQGKFWDWVGYLFTHQAGENQGHFSADNLKQYAKQIGGLDTNKFDACLDSGKYAAKVKSETNQGIALGVQATPTFFVNGQKIEGLLSQDQFAALFDSLLPNK